MSKFTLSNSRITVTAAEAAAAVKASAYQSCEPSFAFMDNTGEVRRGWVESHPLGMKVCFNGHGGDDLVVVAGLIETLPEADLSLPLECNYLRAYARRFKKDIIDAIVAVPHFEGAGNTAVFHITM